jgi:hypothetical protein
MEILRRACIPVEVRRIAVPAADHIGLKLEIFEESEHLAVIFCAFLALFFFSYNALLADGRDRPHPLEFMLPI